MRGFEIGRLQVEIWDHTWGFSIKVRRPGAWLMIDFGHLTIDINK